MADEMLHPSDLFTGGLISAPAWTGYFFTRGDGWLAAVSDESYQRCLDKLHATHGTGPHTSVRMAGTGLPEHVLSAADLPRRRAL